MLEKGSMEKFGGRRSVGEGPRDKSRQRRFAGEGPSEKVHRRRSTGELGNCVYQQKARRAWHPKSIESEQVPSWQVELKAGIRGQPPLEGLD